MTLINNRTGAHRKVRELPVGQIVAGIVLVILTAVLALGAVAIGSQPANASTRPYWNGKGVWTAQADPMCRDLDSYHVGLIQVGQERYWAECLPGGPGRNAPWSWSLVTW